MITEVRTNGIRVMVAKFGLEAAITLYKEPSEKEVALDPSKSKTNPYTLNDEELTLTRKDGKSFRVFQVVIFTISAKFFLVSWTCVQELQVRIFVQESAQRRAWLVVELADEPTTQYAASSSLSSSNPKGTSSKPQKNLPSVSVMGSGANSKRHLDRKGRNLDSKAKKHKKPF